MSLILISLCSNDLLRCMVVDLKKINRQLKLFVQSVKSVDE